MSYEEMVKNKLWNLWVKESNRKNDIDGWKRMRVRLGSGMIKVQGLTKTNKIIETIEDFGIDMDMLDVLNPSYDELYQIYNHINFYRGSVKFLKKLKTDMARKNHEV